MNQTTSTQIVHPLDIQQDDWKHVLLLLLIKFGLSLAKDTMADQTTRVRLVATASDPTAPQMPTHLEV